MVFFIVAKYCILRIFELSEEAVRDNQRRFARSLAKRLRGDRRWRGCKCAAGAIAAETFVLQSCQSIKVLTGTGTLDIFAVAVFSVFTRSIFIELGVTAGV